MNNSLRRQELLVCQRQGHTCGSMFSGEGTEPAKTQRQGHRKEACLSGPVRGSRIEEVQACRLFIVTTVAPAPSDKKALEGVAKRLH